MSHGGACAVCGYAMLLRQGDVWRCSACGLGVDGSRLKVRYVGDATTDQVRWGSNDDPRGVLTPGEAYDVERVEEHSWHTKYWIAGRKYNSVHFAPLSPPRAREE